jgi:hypothetical protein
MSDTIKHHGKNQNDKFLRKWKQQKCDTEETKRKISIIVLY